MVQRLPYTDPKGRKRVRSRWYLSFKGLDGRWSRFPGFTDKRASERAERNVRRLVEIRQSGERLEGEMARWVDTLPQVFREKLVGFGLVDPSRAPASRSLDEHVTGFRAHLEARGTTASHARTQANRVLAVLNGAGLRLVGDLCPDPVRRYLRGQTTAGRSTRTICGHVQALRQFSSWLEREGVISSDPFRHLQRPRGGARSFVRRALTEEEARELVAVTQGEPERFGMTGPERSLLYRLCLEAGLRRREVITLERRALRLENPPTLWVQSKYAKNRREAYLPLRQETAKLLQDHVASMLPGARVFRMANNQRTADMIRADLQPADIEPETEEGIVDFHSLRHTMITRLARSGVHPKVAQELARHSTITLTMDVYSHVAQEEQVRAIEALPALAGDVG